MGLYITISFLIYVFGMGECFCDDTQKVVIFWGRVVYGATKRYTCVYFGVFVEGLVHVIVSAG
jgi:hypothetical protein